ncbi:tenascin-like [Rhinoraja longicauda]
MGHHELISAPAQRLHVGERGVEELLVEVGRHQAAASDPEEPAAPAKLGSLSPPSVTDNSARLSWTPLTTFDSYLLQYRVQGSGETHNVTLPGGKRGYLIVGLLPSTTYTVYIYGITGTKHTQPLTTHITTAGSETKVAKMPEGFERGAGKRARTEASTLDKFGFQQSSEQPKQWMARHEHCATIKIQEAYND